MSGAAVTELSPSGLPAISPSGGEISQSPASKLPITPVEGEMAGRPEGGVGGRRRSGRIATVRNALAGALLLSSFVAPAIAANPQAPVVAAEVSARQIAHFRIGSEERNFGPLEFVAFVVPQIALRLTRGSRPPMVASMVLGACMVVAADLTTRVLVPFALPAGLVTAAIGAPYLIWLLLRTNRRATA